MKPGPGALAAAPVAAALLALALVGVSGVAARSLSARDVAVREGLLTRLGRELESRLKEQGPDAVGETVEAFGRERNDHLAGIELTGPNGTIARFGTPGPAPFTVEAGLGREFRFLIGRQGSGRGSSLMGTAFRIHLTPSARLGSAGPLPAALVAGAVVAGLGLVALALVAARGLAERGRLAALEAERQRLDTLGLAGAGLAYRIRNPLAGIKGTAQQLTGQLEPPARERAQRIVDASVRIERLVDQLLSFTLPPEPRVERMDLAALGVRLGVQPGLAFSTDGPVPVDADPEHVLGIVGELVSNARSLSPGAPIEVSVRRASGRAVVEVLDRGPGLSVDPERAFDPYVTTRPEGTGLGLPIVRALAQANRGQVTLHPRDGGGCVARLSLPLAGA